MELLILLVSRQSQLVTRAEIAQHLWSSQVFADTEHGINTAIRKLRYLLQDDSEEPKLKGGYRALVAFDLDPVEKKSRTQYVSPVKKAILNAELGNQEKALSFLEERFRKHAPEIAFIQCDPEFDFLHSEPRFRAIIKGMGLPPAN